MHHIAHNAMLFALAKHSQQVRKYTGEPYSTHLAEVAGYVAATPHYGTPIEAAVAAAWLHDVCEDCNVSPKEIGEQFGHAIGYAVFLLTDPVDPTKNRAERKRDQRERLAMAPGWVQSIKCADIISNTPSIAKHEPKFAPVYIDECVKLLDVLTSADSGLRALAAIRLQHAAVANRVDVNVMDGARHG